MFFGQNEIVAGTHVALRKADNRKNEDAARTKPIGELI